MKKILITGINSYIGNSVNKWLERFESKYEVELISLKNTDWKRKDFSHYDTILHVAGIAHVSTDPKMEKSYYSVNRDLTIEVASKAKEEGVKQFIFLSSIIVYGNRSSIDLDTIPEPINFYGQSKLQAEIGIKKLENENFKIVIIRPPMIYGKNSKGNYIRLSNLAKKVPFFPDYPNKRSMLYIDNLCEFIRLLIENEERGLFFPQNKEYINTSTMVKVIGRVHGKNIILVKLFNPILTFTINKITVVNKLFGNLVYKQSLSVYKENYQLKDMKESIRETESRT